MLRRSPEPDFDATVDDEVPREMRPWRRRLMYIEDKSAGLEGPARVGYVYFSKSGRTLYYAGRKFRSLKGAGLKANYSDVEGGEHYWISGPRKDGSPCVRVDVAYTVVVPA